MKVIKRELEKPIKDSLFKGKVVVLYGPRQVGKTTLVKKILSELKDLKTLYLNCERPVVKQALGVLEPARVKDYFGEAQLVVLDEAQHLREPGLLLKLMVDTYPEVQILATGSSSFALAQKVSEPLTGRVNQFLLYPLSLTEIAANFGKLETETYLEKVLMFGAYPEVFLAPEKQARLRVDEIATHYLYKDVLAYANLRKASLIEDLLKLLALQVGSEVNLHELAQQLGVSRPTVKEYLDLLEQSFVVFRLRAFSRNLRKEISKSFKVYFYDLGIRNSLIRNFNPMSLRPDVGALWENLMVVERLKRNSYRQILANYYFWRTYDKKEIDLIEEREGKLFAFEFKWSLNKKTKKLKVFLTTYPQSRFQVVTPADFWSFIG